MPDTPAVTARSAALDADPDERFAVALDLTRCALAMTLTADRFIVGLVSALGEVVAAQSVPTPAAADWARVGSAMVDGVLHAAGVDRDVLGALPGIGLSVAKGLAAADVIAAL